MAGLRVGQACGVFNRPRFGLLVSFPRPLSTQPPFTTQALMERQSSLRKHAKLENSVW